jgi:hypothetical protein
MLLIASVASAQYAIVSIEPDQAGTDGCDFDLTPFVLQTAYVLVTANPIQSIQFSAPLPACLNAVYFDDVSTGHLWLGNSQTGVTIQFPAPCSARWGPDSYVLGIRYTLLGSVEECCEWTAQPHSGTGQLSAVDCDGATVAASGFYRPVNGASCCTYASPVPSPYNPYPPDEAAGVPTDVILSWEGSWLYYQTVSLGTEDPLTLHDASGGSTFDPGGLEPNTTYYWRVAQSDGFESGNSSALWSFTTGASVRTQPSTWSTIKALYW